MPVKPVPSSSAAAAKSHVVGAANVVRLESFAPQYVDVRVHVPTMKVEMMITD